jgi:octaprenyl-diphosphate synthase
MNSIALTTSTSDIRDIIAPVRTELHEFERHFRGALKSNIGLVDTIVRYMVKRKGKRIRPALVLLAAGTCGVITERAYRAASLVELLHTATLIHDDVVDEAATRRGLASINAIWKNKVSVLMGDYILARGLLLSLASNDYAFLQCTSQAVRRMSEGELLQIQKSRQMNTDEETYFRIIGDKTASLLSTCCELGALSASSEPEDALAMREFGENLGIAFQIRDDLLDFVGKESMIGKPVGGDLKEKKFTLPLIHAFSQAPFREKRRIMRLVKDGIEKKGIEEVVRFVKEFGGIDYAERRADEYRTRARASLERFPCSPSRQSLLQFVDYVVTRAK